MPDTATTTKVDRIPIFVTTASDLPSIKTNEDFRVAVAIDAVFGATHLDVASRVRVLRALGEKYSTHGARDLEGLEDDDPQAAFDLVRLRSLGAMDELLDAEGGGKSDREFSKAAHISRDTVGNYRRAGTLIAWEKDRRNFRYPAWQAHRGRLLHGLQEVLTVLKPLGMDPLALIDYFLSESDELGGCRPLDALRKNEVSAVIEHAKRYGQTGA